MILVNKNITALCKQKKPLIEPFREKQVQLSSYDLRLEKAERDTILPGEFMLGTTEEIVNIPGHLRGQVKGKSSVAREGLMVECAGLCDPGFSGQITLELKNLSDKPINLKKFKTICQIEFGELKEVPDGLYSGHYQNQRGITPSWMEKFNPGKPCPYYPERQVGSDCGFRYVCEECEYFRELQDKEKANEKYL